MIPTARRFNPFLCAGSDAMRRTVAELLKQLDGYEDYYQLRKRKRREADQRTYERTVEAVICDLIHRELTSPGGKVHVSQSNQLLRKQSRYKGEAYNNVNAGSKLAHLAEVILAHPGEEQARARGVSM